MSNAARITPATPPTGPPIVAACKVDDEDEIDGETSGEGAVAFADEDAAGFGRRILSAAIDKADTTDKADKKTEGKGTVSGFASADMPVVVVVVRIFVLLVGEDVVVVRHVVLLVDLDVDGVAVVMKVGWSGKTVTTSFVLQKSARVSQPRTRRGIREAESPAWCLSQSIVTIARTDGTAASVVVLQPVMTLLRCD